MHLQPDRAEEIVRRFPEQRILVVGDIMLDRYIFGEAQRISPEAPVPVVKVSSESEVPGGSSNVGLNIATLGGHAALCGIIGDDFLANRLSVLLQESRLGIDGVLVKHGHPTTVKTRIIAQRQQVVRVDNENSDGLAKETVEELCQVLERMAGKATGIVIEDYGKGVVSQPIADAAIAAARKADIPIAFDPKNNHELNVKGVTVAAPNRKETFEASGIADRSGGLPPLEDDPLLLAGEKLYERWGPEMLITTLGDRGMLLHIAGESPLHVPTRAREVFDVSGAGDTVIGVCVLALAAGASHLEAAEIANFAAGVVVGKLGTASTTPDELLHFMSEVEA